MVIYTQGTILNLNDTSYWYIYFTTDHSIWNAFLTEAVFVSFCDINLKREKSFFKFLFVMKKLQNSFTANVENVHRLLHYRHGTL
jgi:hypothetical protein